MSNFLKREYPRHLCLHELFEQQVDRTPQATACAFDNEQLSYAELNSRANQLAHYLMALGAGPGRRIGIFVERSLAMLVGLLGIQKSGAAYVPLDPVYPAERIRMMLEDAKIAVLVTQQGLLKNLPAHPAQTVCLDTGADSIAGQPQTNPVTGVNSGDLLYVIFTSGSTGRPKGVQITHRSAVNLLRSMQSEPGLTSSDTLLAVTTLAFDIAGLELYLPLVTGARVWIASYEQCRDGRQLIQELERSQASVMQATPATWRLLLEAGWKGTSRLKVLCGGEALSPELASQLIPRCRELWNMYGPTETTIWSSVYKVKTVSGTSIPIGRPIANTTMYVVGEGGELLPTGVPGELLIGGDGVAAGYLDRADLTAEKFVPDPGLPAQKAYRTGDIVKALPDGNLIYLGRRDHQAKLHGFRIELGEIEAVLDQHPGVRQSVVVLIEKLGESRLVGYVTPAGDKSPEPPELRAWLSERLPEYMVPVAIVRLARLPLTPNGKVDRKSLPEPQPEDFRTKQEYVPPRDTVERKLVALWEDVLGIRPLGITENFFNLGGRSVLAARLFIKISRAFGRELPLSTLIDAPTIEQLANKLRPTTKAERYPTLVCMRPGGSNPPFFCVHGGAGSTLFLERLAKQLSREQPFYGIEPEGLDGSRFQRTTIEQMAAHYLAEIRKVQPAGPYYLGGYCFGGVVAFEMAQQLLRQEERADLVVLFTAPLRFNRLIPVSPKSQPDHSLSTLRQMPAAQVIAAARRALRWRWRRLSNVIAGRIATATYILCFTLGFKIPASMRTMYVVRTLSGAERRYVPSPYPGTLVLFYGEDMDDGGWNQGWNGLAEGFEHRIIGEGGKRLRRDLMYEPLVGITARELTACIEKARISDREKSVACL